MCRFPCRLYVNEFGLSRQHRNPVFGAIFVVTVIAPICSLFDSDLYMCFDRSITDGDVETDTRVEPRLEREEFLWREWILTPKASSDFARFKGTELRIVAPLEKARTHLYHVSLPRDSMPG